MKYLFTVSGKKAVPHEEVAVAETGRCVPPEIVEFPSFDK